MKLQSYITALLPVLLTTLLLSPGDASTPQEKEKPMAEQVEDVAGDEDPYGMRTWYLALLKRGPEYHTSQGAERTELFAGHFANMEELALDGYLRLAGPFGVPANAPKDAYAGLFLLDVKTLAEAHELCKTDPTIQAKVFGYELLEWYGPSDITYRGDPTPPAKRGAAK